MSSPSPSWLSCDVSSSEPSPAADISACDDDELDDDESGSDADSDSEGKGLVPTKSEREVTGRVQITQKGIYTIWQHIPPWRDSIPGSAVLADLEGFVACWPYVKRLLKDLWGLGPLYCAVYAGATLVQSALPALRLAQTSHLLKMIETSVITRQVHRPAFITAIGLQLAVSALDWAASETTGWCGPIIQRRFKYHFNQRLLDVRLRIDLPTSEDPDVKAKLDAAEGTSGEGKAWEAFSSFLRIAGTAVQFVSTSGYIAGSLMKEPGGGTVAMLCMINPLLNCIQYREWTAVFFATVTNLPYLRMRSLDKFVDSNDRKPEILGNVMGDYLRTEYGRARTEFGDTNDGHIYELDESWSPFSLIRNISADSALIFLALKMMVNPGEISLSNIAILSQMTQTLEYTMYRVLEGGGSLMQSFTGIRALYEINDIKNVMEDGTEPYPAPSTGEKHRGMKIELRNISFKYPYTESQVIKGLSFTIPAGALCVIVGENGCGKSSTIKLLTRLYDVDEGEILVDDRPIKDYKLDDLRGASAVMYQDYMHFHFTLGENIGFGNVNRIQDEEAIRNAARLGGAHDFIEKLPGGYGTKMAEDKTTSNGDAPEGSALEAMVKGVKQPPHRLSGGQTQRLALSRTFMRSTTCEVSLLAYDEPSAALDPKAEFDLFERLRELREGRTMLFVTHRFGYLTKYADLIIYMDDGRAVEQGSHEELLALDGKYAHMYNVQAKAFK